MNRAKIMLAGLGVLATIGGLSAFKAAKTIGTVNVFYKQGSTCPLSSVAYDLWQTGNTSIRLTDVTTITASASAGTCKSTITFQAE